jgi:hypothetical protein
MHFSFFSEIKILVGVNYQLATYPRPGHIPDQQNIYFRPSFLELKKGGNFCRFQKAFFTVNRSNCAAAVLSGRCTGSPRRPHARARRSGHNL